MTGFEYSFAGLLISEGYIDEGLTVIRAIRNRYDDEKRNPFNEIECGSNYARPMSSFALLPIFSGLEYDLPKKYIGFSPVLKGDYKCFFGLGTGWGDLIRKNNIYKIIIKSGYLELSNLSVKCKIKNLFIDSKEISFKQNGKNIEFESITANKEILIEV